MNAVQRTFENRPGTSGPCIHCGLRMAAHRQDETDPTAFLCPEIPVKPGYYWAKWRIPAEDTHEGNLMTPSDVWEIVQVNVNSVDWDDDPLEHEALTVAIPGVRESQWRDCFIWGDFVAPLGDCASECPSPARPARKTEAM